MKNTLKRTVAVFLLSLVVFTTLNNKVPYKVNSNNTINNGLIPCNDEFGKLDVA